MISLAKLPRCPVCRGTEKHRTDCRIKAVFDRAASPRDEFAYMDGYPRLFEPADYIERGMHR